MHGCGSGSALLVNAEVDSMGGVVDGGVGVGVKTSPRRVAIEKAQAELRQEYDVREERRRELEFLEKGGNPLDFKFGNTTSLSVQSTSLTDQQAEHFVASEAKGSFALTASPHGDSVESSGRPGVLTVCEPNSADNLLLFDGENELLEGERNSLLPNRRNRIAQSEHSSQMDGTQNAKESEDSAIVRPYARRNRSKINRDAARSSSTDMNQTRGGHGSSVPVRGGTRDARGLAFETTNQKDQNLPSASNLNSATSNGDINPKILSSDNKLSIELDRLPSVTETPSLTKASSSKNNMDLTASKSWKDSQNDKISCIGAQQDSYDRASRESVLDGGREEAASAGPGCPPCESAIRGENEGSSDQLSGFEHSKGDRKSIVNDDQSSNAAVGTKRLDSDSSCTRNSLGLDVNNDNNASVNLKNSDSNGLPMSKSSGLERTPNLTSGEMVNGKIDVKSIDNDDNTSIYKNHTGNGLVVKVEDETQRTMPDLQNEVSCSSKMKVVQQNDHIMQETEGKACGSLGSSPKTKEKLCTGKPGSMVNIHDVPNTTLSGANSASPATEPKLGSSNALKLGDKAHEDSILEEARIIEAKRKRIAELSVGTLPLENHRKSHWDFVLEEMAWLANDFAQERLWKMTAAAQICHRVAFTSRSRFEEKNQHWELKKVAFSLADAVMQFWHTSELRLNSADPNVGPKDGRHGFVGGNEASDDKERNKVCEIHNPGKNTVLEIQEYALRFLKYNRTPVPHLQAEAPKTPERISDSGIMDVSWDDHLTEESLFYAVPSGAMENYRKWIESHLVHFEKTGSSVQEEVETSMYDAAAEFGYNEGVFEEDEGETSTYYLAGGCEGNKSSKFTQKKRRNLIKSHIARSYELGADFPYSNYSTGSHQSMLLGKRPANNLNVGSIPTKRIRTASRQRVVSPFGAGAAGSLQLPAKTDASSGDTSSFQDDQSTLHGGFHIQKNMEVESTGDFEKQSPYDCAETSAKPKKKKKPKHLASAFEQGWQLDSNVHNDQRDHLKKRLDSHHFESNGLYGQHNPKKPKIMKQSHENTFDNITPITGSVPSPVASQMSNMSNPNKIIKFIAGRDRGRKAKALKISTSQPGSGSPWSIFEDQALIVLVHDMGPNWELVSDAINSTIQFKCVFRKPKECKERHKILMDRGAGDGADSAEDSGSSQSYPSTLPGIPKGSASKLFQRLHWPMEEDTLKSHFEKIIMIGKKQHYRRSQNDNQDSKQIVPVHNSHVVALSQVCPNNLNGSILTPLDLCDATASQDVVSLGFQGSHPGSLGISNQGSVASILPTSGANSSLQGSSGMVLSGNLPSPPGPLNTPVRDGRYNVPRASLPVDDQHRMQQYNQILSGRNMQQSNLSVPGAVSGGDRGLRMAPGGTGMGVMCGVNRGMPISRPGFQGVASSTMLNSANMLSPSMVGMPSPVNMHSGGGSGQGNSMMRPREAMQMIRPGSNSEHQRQLMAQDLQMQVTQGNSQGIPAFNGMSSGFPNQTPSPPVQAYSGHPQQQHQISAQQSHALSNSHHPHLPGPNHATGAQQQAYAIRQRQMQQRYMQQQQQQHPHQQQHQQQFATSGALMSHVQPLPVSSSLQNSSQIQSQPSSQALSMAPLSASSPVTPMALQHQQKHQLPHHGMSRNPQSGTGLTNQIAKQRQRQPQQQQFQQSGRQHPQQRQQAQSQQQAKLLKGIGRANIVGQNFSVDPSHLNGLPMVPGNQAAEKGEQITHLMQSQGLYSGSGVNPVQPSRPLVPQSSNHSQAQQKVFSGSIPPSSKQLQQVPSHSDNSTQIQPVSTGHTLGSHQSILQPAITANNNQHSQLQGQPHQKQINQTQSAAQRIPQNRQGNTDSSSKAQMDHIPADPQLGKNASQANSGATAAVPQTCIDSVNIIPATSTAVGSQWKASEPLYESGMPNTSKVGASGGPSLTNAAGTDSVPSASQGLGQRQLSGSLPSHGHVGAQWQQQSQLQQSSTSQQQYQLSEQQQLQQEQQQSSQQQLPPQKQSHQQMQHLQPAAGSLYIRPSNSKVE